MTTTAKAPLKTDAKIKKETLDRIQTLFTTLDGFSTIIEKETQALKDLDFKTVDSLQEKRQLACMYQELVQDLMQHKDALSKLDLHTRENLVRRRTNFTMLLTENMKALENMRDSAQRLAGKILDVARQTLQEDTQTNYSPKGQTQSYKSSTLSLNLDQSL